MSLVFEERTSDSPYVASITHGHTLADGSTTRPAEVHWHLVFVKHQGAQKAIVVGPWSTAGTAAWGAEAEILWVRFKLGVFMPHLPARQVRDVETVLPNAPGPAFRLYGSTWPFPDFNNVETFIGRLARQEVLVQDPLVNTVLQDHPHDFSLRTVRHRFLQATGLSQSHIRQFQRAQQAVDLLNNGASILDTVFAAGYFDQPHLTRALKRFIGATPAQQTGRAPAPA